MGRMARSYTTLLGKAVRKIAMIRGGGSALPGLFVEKIDPMFVKATLASLPYGVVVISGTNGKTTTTKIVVDLLRSQGLSVFTNRTGSNFVRGVAAALLGEINNRGELHADIAVLELDEAHAVHFVETVAPRYSLLLNVMRDQLDRFGEIDKTAEMLHDIAVATTGSVIINRDDPRLGNARFVEDLGAVDIRSYGTHPELKKHFPSDDELHDDELLPLPHSPSTLYAHDTSLEAINETTHSATIAFDGADYTISLKLSGIYNILNATAAVALVRAILGSKLDKPAMLEALQNVTPAFGRGESVQINGQPCELVLVKNPAGFRLSLKSFPPDGVATMIAINDNYADGRDMSWLWDVDFSSLKPQGVLTVSGMRAYDMALRLQYDDIKVDHISTHLADALREFIHTSPDQPKRIYCTYTAMLALRKQLTKYTTVEEVRA